MVTLREAEGPHLPSAAAVHMCGLGGASRRRVLGGFQRWDCTLPPAFPHLGSVQCTRQGLCADLGLELVESETEPGLHTHPEGRGCRRSCQPGVIVL